VVHGKFYENDYLCKMSFSGRTVAFHTLGCKLNFAETSTIARLFQEKGFKKTAFAEAADVYVINTCSVTENADKECRSIVRSALSKNPEAFVAVVGCYAQLKPEEISSIPGVDVVLGATEKFRLLNYISLSTKATQAVVHNCEIAEADFFVDSFSMGDRTRSFLKVQDGCDYSCTFCTIPLARGKSRSDSIGNVVANANRIAAAGVREIVLTGVNIGDFGYGQEIETGTRKQRHHNFYDLIQELDKVEKIERFRISSIEPNLLEDRIIEFVAASDKFVPHFHMPLQSGSNEILKKMQRRYKRELYAARVEKIRQLMPECCIGVDVIVGFPGETEEHFLDTYNFLNTLDISYLHVFTYSERDHTPAAAMEGKIPESERKRRNKMLRILSAKKLRGFYEENQGKSLEVLFEHESREGFLYGYTRNYVRVKYPFDESLCNRSMMVTIGDFDGEGVMLCRISEQVLEIPVV
jgi:threonylcarbamoyladenosine tRNA methylthiotransferase MtaB